MDKKHYVKGKMACLKSDKCSGKVENALILANQKYLYVWLNSIARLFFGDASFI